MEGDGVIVRIIPEGVSERIFDTHWKESSVFVRCRQRSLEYSVTSQTFKLTLLGKVPEKQRFRVEYGRFPLGRDGVTGTDLCRDPRLEWPGDIPPACRGGTTHRKTVPQVTSPPSRETWRVRWIRATTDCTLPRADPSMCEFRDQVFHTSRLSPAKGGTHSAWYDFDTHKGGTGAGPEGLMPGAMPSTGGGGMARLTR
jgi:hypothetical protein